MYVHRTSSLLSVVRVGALQYGEQTKRGRAQRALQSPRNGSTGSAEVERRSGALLPAPAGIGGDLHDCPGDLSMRFSLTMGLCGDTTMNCARGSGTVLVLG